MPGPYILTPPTVAEFRAWSTPAGGGSARLEIASVAIEIEGLPESLLEVMSKRYVPYLGRPTGSGRPLKVRMTKAPLDYFIQPGFTSHGEEYRMLTSLEDGVFRTVSYRLASWIDVTRREGIVALAQGELDPAPRAVENFLRSSVAWLAIDGGGFFLHGASIVRSGRGYLFYGPSGAGKSTLSALSAEGEVISDDLSLIVKGPEGLLVAGAPFRGTYTAGRPVVGTFPVAGFYRLRKDTRTEVRPGDGACFADLLGNLPFIVDQLPRQPHLMEQIRRLVDSTPLRYLHFRKDQDFWPAIDASFSGANRPATK